MHAALIKIQELFNRNEADLSSILTAQEPLREVFNGIMTGCRLTLAALNIELDKLVEPKKGMKLMEIGFQAKARLVWKEDIMIQLRDQTRGQMPSLESPIHLLMDTHADIPRLLKQYTADIRKDDNDYQSSIHSAHQPVAGYEMAPPYEMQSAQFPAYQWARTAVAEELFASKIEFLDEKCAREERLEDLLSEVALRDVKVTQLEHKLLLKDDIFGSLEHDISMKDRRRLPKDERVNELNIEKIEYRRKSGISIIHQSITT